MATCQANSTKGPRQRKVESCLESFKVNYNKVGHLSIFFPSYLIQDPASIWARSLSSLHYRLPSPLEMEAWCHFQERMAAAP